MKNFIIKNKLIFAIIISTLSLFILGYFDLSLSKLVAQLSNGNYYSYSSMARLIEYAGETPFYLFINFALFVLLILEKDIKNKKLSVFLQIITFLLIAFFFAFGIIRVLNNYNDVNGLSINNVALLYISFGIFSVILTLFIWLLLKRINKEFFYKLIPFALIIIFTALISNVVVQVLKTFACRMRYRTLYYLNANNIGDYKFQKWFEFRKYAIPEALYEVGIGKDGFKSFPSGHTCAIAITLTLFCLPNFIDKLNNKLSKILLFSTSSLIVIIVAIYRIIMGAHYLTDVASAVFIVIISIIISYDITKKIVKANK